MELKVRPGVFNHQLRVATVKGTTLVKTLNRLSKIRLHKRDVAKSGIRRRVVRSQFEQRFEMPLRSIVLLQRHLARGETLKRRRIFRPYLESMFEGLNSILSTAIGGK